jgi:hypothetical protein
MIGHVDFVRTVIEEHIASIIKLWIGLLGTTLAVISNWITLRSVNVVSRSLILVTLMIEVIYFSGTLVLTRATRRIISEDGILHSHRCGNLTSDIQCFLWDTNLKSYTAVISLSTTDRYSVFREVRTSNLTQQSYPLAQLTDTVFSVRYEPQILHSNHIP